MTGLHVSATSVLAEDDREGVTPTTVGGYGGADAFFLARRRSARDMVSGCGCGSSGGGGGRLRSASAANCGSVSSDCGGTGFSSN